MTNSIKRVASGFHFVAVLLFFGCQSSNKKGEALNIKKDSLTLKPLVSELDTVYLGERLIEIKKASGAGFNSYQADASKFDTSEVYNLNRDSALVKRRGDTLIFKTAVKEVFLFNINDEEQEAGLSIYSYLGFDNDLDQYVVHGSYYEGSDYILIDKQTGGKTNVPGIPMASPDKKLFITGNVDLIAGFDFNGINLYSNTHPPKLLGSKPLNSWGPEEIKWVNDSTLFVKARVADTTTENLEKESFFELLIK
jgi:hypothetical protein